MALLPRLRQIQQEARLELMLEEDGLCLFARIVEAG